MPHSKNLSISVDRFLIFSEKLHVFVQLLCHSALRAEGLLFLLLEVEWLIVYYKQARGAVLVRKSTSPPQWVQWRHRNEGKTHCTACLMLDGCYFTEFTHPPCPHHPFCHCTMEPVDYGIVLMDAVAKSDHRKYDPYLFNTHGTYTHNKEKLFLKWGYTVEDADWLQAEMERQALEKYLAGDYQLGKLNHKGQRISIRVTIIRRDTGEPVSFETGWMVHPKGWIQLSTPYGGK